MSWRLCAVGAVLTLACTGSVAPAVTEPPAAPVSASAPTPEVAVPTNAVPSEIETPDTPEPISVPPSAVRKITLDRLGFSQSVVAKTTVEMGGVIDPPYATLLGASPVVWVSDKGSAPSSESPRTTYMACHASIKHPSLSDYPCNALTHKVIAGDTFALTTDTGKLTYRVGKTLTIPYEEFASNDEIWGSYKPNRFVFVMCDVVDGNATHMNFVVIAYLSAWELL